MPAPGVPGMELAPGGLYSPGLVPLPHAGVPLAVDGVYAVVPSPARVRDHGKGDAGTDRHTKDAVKGGHVGNGQWVARQPRQCIVPTVDAAGIC